VLDGIRKILRLAGHAGSAPATAESRPAVAAVSHGYDGGDERAFSRSGSRGWASSPRRASRHVLGDRAASGAAGVRQLLLLVKPDRIVPLHLVREVPERSIFCGEVAAPVRRAAAVKVAAGSVRTVSTPSAVSFIHAYANPEHEQRMRAVLEA